MPFLAKAAKTTHDQGPLLAFEATQGSIGLWPVRNAPHRRDADAPLQTIPVPASG